MIEGQGNRGEKANSFKAFVTGYSKKKFRFDVFKEIIQSKFPSINTVTSPNNKQYWSGYAFLTFDSEKTYSRLLDIRRIKIKELEMTVVINKHKEGDELKKFMDEVKKRKLKVDKIPLSWDDSTLERFFEDIAQVESAFIFKKIRKKQKFHQGIVTFFSVADTIAASQIKKYQIENTEKFITVKRAIDLKYNPSVPKNSKYHQKSDSEKRRESPKLVKHVAMYQKRYTNKEGRVRLAKKTNRIFFKDKVESESHWVKPSSKLYYKARPHYSQVSSE